MNTKESNPNSIKEGLDECISNKDEPIVKKCALCQELGVYRYAPHDFKNNWPESERWRCHDHGKQFHGDPEWDYFGII